MTIGYEKLRAEIITARAAMMIALAAREAANLMKYESSLKETSKQGSSKSSSAQEVAKDFIKQAEKKLAKAAENIQVFKSQPSGTEQSLALENLLSSSSFNKADSVLMKQEINKQISNLSKSANKIKDDIRADLDNIQPYMRRVTIDQSIEIQSLSNGRYKAYHRDPNYDSFNKRSESFDDITKMQQYLKETLGVDIDSKGNVTTQHHIKSQHTGDIFSDPRLFEKHTLGYFMDSKDNLKLIGALEKWAKTSDLKLSPASSPALPSQAKPAAAATAEATLTPQPQAPNLTANSAAQHSAPTTISHPTAQILDKSRGVGVGGRGGGTSLSRVATAPKTTIVSEV
jgi:hypothetical protein